MKTNLTQLLLALLILSDLRAVAVTRYVDLNSPSPTPPYTSWSTAATNIQDAIDAASNFDRVLVTNGLYNTGGRTGPGSSVITRVVVAKPVTLESMNGAGVTSISGDDVVRCVYLTNGAAIVGFTIYSGMTSYSGDQIRDRSGGGVWAETNGVVSDCVISYCTAAYTGAGVYGGMIRNSTLTWDWTDGVLAFGGGGASSAYLTNCTLTSNRSYYGGAAYACTLVDCVLSGNYAGGGGGASQSLLERCVISGNNAQGGGVADCRVFNCVLSGNTASDRSGGGAISSSLVNCTLTGNSARYGGGAANSQLTNCLVNGNSAQHGGGADHCTLNNCTLIGNAGAAANYIGNAYECIMNNCIVYYSAMGRNYIGGTLNYCCTTPLPPSGVGNFTNLPLFVNSSARLQTNSPCINSGNNQYTIISDDLDGNPRIVGGTVDIGAYEFQSPSSVLSYAWAQLYGLPTDGLADFSDPDGDGMNNYGEWRSDTIPTNALSVLRMVNATNSPPGATVTWQSVPTRNYWLERATNLGVASPFESIATNIVGVAGTKTYTDTSATNGGPYFYRVGVQ